MGSKFGCVTVPTNTADEKYSNIQTHNGVRLPKHMIMDSKSKASIIYDMEKANSASNATTKSLKSSKSSKSKSSKPRLINKRTSVRHIQFESNPSLPDLDCDHDSDKSNSPSSDVINNDFLIEYLECNIPNLPIRFAKQHEIWLKEYDLFTEYLSQLIFDGDKSKTEIIKVILELAEIDMIICNTPNLPITSNRGLWPQHYILNESNNNLNENGMILPMIRDELIHSFNLQSIFEIAGNCFVNATQSGLSANKFFCFGIDCELDMYSSYNLNANTKGYPSSNNMHEPHDGYTSTASSIANNNINPLKFKIYSHNIMVCHKGFHIERHNEDYEEHDDDIENRDNNTDPTYFFTLILLPPNISSYSGLHAQLHTTSSCILCIDGSKIILDRMHASHNVYL